MKIKNLGYYLALIVLIVTMNTTVRGEKLTEEQMTAYRTRPAVVLVYSGMFVNIALNNGQQYRVPNYGSGSGFFINPEGYLVTNGHVVDTYVKYMNDKSGYAQKVFNNYIMQKIIADFKQSGGREPGQQEIEFHFNKYMKTYQPRISDHGAINYVVLSNSETLRFEVKKFSPSIPDGGKDIAIIKIERENCPVIMLGDSSKLSLQQMVFTIGFPAVVDPQRFPLLGKENTLKSSITRGSISALKTDYKGMSVIQHDAATSPGNSGGPTVTADGKVIGVHSYAALQYDGFKFCVPINAAKEFIRDAGVQFNQLSEFTQIYNKLLKSVWEEKWFDAQTQVSTALAYMKNEPDLEHLQRKILQRINEMGFFEKLWHQNSAIVIVALFLIVLIIVVLYFSFRPTSTKEPAEPVKEQSIKKPEEDIEAMDEDKTKLFEEDGTIFEEDVAGTLVVMIKGEEQGSYPITNTAMILGRDPNSATVLVKSEFVSKNHLKIIPKGDQFYIVDLGSTNGTFVNGEKITETLVNPNDAVQLGKRGDVMLVFQK
jgi:serine protease Do